MLTHLQIRDFAIIDGVELELRPGLTVLTGETGAGKSIVVDALQLLAGGRAGAEVVRHGAERAEIAATFDMRQAPRELKAFSRTEIRPLPVRYSFPSSLWLFGNYLLLLQTREKPHFCVHIHDLMLAQSLRIIFSMLWERK